MPARFIDRMFQFQFGSHPKVTMFQMVVHADHCCLARPWPALVFEVVGGSEQSICAYDGVPRPRGRPSPVNHLALTEIGFLIS